MDGGISSFQRLGREKRKTTVSRLIDFLVILTPTLAVGVRVGAASNFINTARDLKILVVTAYRDRTSRSVLGGGRLVLQIRIGTHKVITAAKRSAVTPSNGGNVASGSGVVVTLHRYYTEVS